MSLGVKLTIGCWVALILYWLLFAMTYAMFGSDLFTFAWILTFLTFLITFGLGLAASFFLAKEKNFDTTKMAIAIVIYLLCCGPLVPLGLLFLPEQEG